MKKQIITHKQILNKTGKKILLEKMDALFTQKLSELNSLEAAYTSIRGGITYDSYKRLRSSKLKVLNAIELIQKEVSNA